MYRLINRIGTKARTYDKSFNFPGEVKSQAPSDVDPPTKGNFELIIPQSTCDNDDFWQELSCFLSNDFHSALTDSYPNLSLFEKHEGIDRGKQRPHDRYYLSLGNSKYHRGLISRFKQKQGSIRSSNLPAPWQLFIKKLCSTEYRAFIDSMLNTSNYTMRFAWHMGFSGAEVCPHLDNSLKLGTHIFYFNTILDWKSEWGGETVVLSDLQNESECPEFEDFSRFHQVTNIGNNSLFFRNSPTSWHGVRPLLAPSGSFRKIFTVIFDTPNSIY